MTWTLRFPFIHRAYRLVFILTAGLIVLALTGCVSRFDPDAMQPKAAVEAPPVYGAHTVGQTFISARPRLRAIAIAWQSSGNVPGPLVLHLRSAPTSTTDIVRVEIASKDEREKQAQRGQAMGEWRFPPIPESQDQSFYFFIQAPQATPDYPLRMDAVAHDIYAPGSAYADGVPWPGDLTFYTFYDYGALMLWSDLIEGLGKIWLLLPLAALLLAPGFLVLQAWPAARDRFDGWEQAALSLGLSLAVIPWLLLWITQLGGALNTMAARVLFWGCGIVALVLSVANRKSQIANRKYAWLMALVLGVGLIVRLLAVRDLAFPAWVDSVHHTLVARIIAESGRVPATYEPYVAVKEATYHYGFQAVVAGFVWLTNLALPQAMLIVGQVLNLAAALQVYLLARWLTQRRRAAFFAALVVALLATMPAYYASWGRYTQLAGLLILPVAVILSVESIQQGDKADGTSRAALLSVLALAGLILTHYRVFAFYACFIGAWWLVELASAPQAWRSRLRETAGYVAVGVLALVSLMPWILGVAENLWLHAFVQWGSAKAAVYWDFSWRYVSGGLDRYLLTLGGLGAIVALVKRRRFSGVLLLWMGALFVITNPSRFGLPGEGLINNVAMLITWFIPLAVWCGYLADELLESWLVALRARWHPLCYRAVAAGLIVLSAIGLRHQITIVDPNNVLALGADREALAWIREHTPPTSRFLINTQPWQDPTYIGSDGGYWITPLTQRSTTTPPVLYSLGAGDDVLHIQTFAQQVEALAGDPAGLWALLREENVDYVYIGALGGPLDPAVLQTSPEFHRLYEDERTHIFEVVK